MTDTTPENPEDSERWVLIRDVALLQVKLIVDGLRDLVLVPASLIAGLASLFSTTPPRESYFYRLICMGKQSEQWINLFDAYDNAADSVKRDYELEASSMDDVLKRVEGYVVNEYQKGGLTRQAKDKVDEALRDIKKSVHRT